MYELNSLRNDNGGKTSAEAISSDGTVAVGYSETESGEQHNVVWKLDKESTDLPPESTEPTEPTKPIKPVDVDNSSYAISKTGYYGLQVLDLYKNTLNQLRQNRCYLGSNSYCIGVSNQYSSINSNHSALSGLTFATRLPIKNMVIGATIGYPVWSKLNSGYKAKGSNKLGMGLFVRYETSTDGLGFSSEISGSLMRQDISITRQTLSNTEAGKGDSQIKGYELGIKAMYGLRVNSNLLISPFVAFVHSQVERKQYTEVSGADFLASYGKFGYKDNDLKIGVNLYSNYNKVFINGSFGASKRISHHQDNFTSEIPYIGSYKYKYDDKRNTRAFAFIDAGYKLSKDQIIATNIGWQQTHFNNNALQIGLNYSYRW